MFNARLHPEAFRVGMQQISVITVDRTVGSGANASSVQLLFANGPYGIQMRSDKVCLLQMPRRTEQTSLPIVSENDDGSKIKRGSVQKGTDKQVTVVRTESLGCNHSVGKPVSDIRKNVGNAAVEPGCGHGDLASEKWSGQIRKDSGPL